jgi:hypothetical protein
MEKRSSDKWDSFVKEDFEIIEEERVKLEPPASVRLRSNYPDRLIVIGNVTGNRYEFPRGGSELPVANDDAPEMLTKTFGGNSCCGSGAKPVHKFSVVE